jgi:hypothetical protein
MNGRIVRTPGRSITARPSPAEKARFSTLAHAAGISESRLALLAIRAFVEAEGRAQAPAEYDPAAERARATDRITIRLRPGDGGVIALRARARGVKTATYLAAMARAHIAADPPLFAHELAALKQSIGTLAGLGILLGRSIRSPALNASGLEEVRQILCHTRAAVRALEQCTHDFAKAALMAWESRFDE